MDWQGRCSQLIALILTGRTFGPGEFESLDDTQWAALMPECRDVVGTDARIEVAALREQLKQLSAREAARQKAIAAGLTEADLLALAEAR